MSAQPGFFSASHKRSPFQRELRSNTSSSVTSQQQKRRETAQQGTCKHTQLHRHCTRSKTTSFCVLCPSRPSLPPHGDGNPPRAATNNTRHCPRLTTPRTAAVCMVSGCEPTALFHRYRQQEQRGWQRHQSVCHHGATRPRWRRDFSLRHDSRGFFASFGCIAVE